jgi:hypothetical protein
VFHKFQHFLLVKRFFAQFTPYPFKSSKEGFFCMFVKLSVVAVLECVSCKGKNIKF